MAWCRQATSHYLGQCWPRSPMPYGVNRPQWVIYQHRLVQKNHIYFDVSWKQVNTSWVHDPSHNLYLWCCDTHACCVGPCPECNDCLSQHPPYGIMCWPSVDDVETGTAKHWARISKHCAPVVCQETCWAWSYCRAMRAGIYIHICKHDGTNSSLIKTKILFTRMPHHYSE